MKKIIFLFALTTMALKSILGQSSSVEIWIRVFIPNSANAGGGSNFIRAISNNRSLVALHNFNPSLPNECFETDHRGFSSDPNKTSRLETKFKLTANENGTGTITPTENRTVAAMTKKVNCATGTILQQGMGSVDRDHLGNPTIADGIVQVIGQVQGRNLLTLAGGNGPSIDYSFDIQWYPSTKTIIAAVTIGSFPAFEMYARLPNGTWRKVIQQLPTGAPWRLGGDGFGINSSRIVQTVVVN